MKEKIRLIAAIVCLFHLLAAYTVSANSGIVTPDVSDNSIVVSGELSTERAKTDLILRMKDKDGSIVLAEFTTSWFKGEEVVFEFDKILMPNSLESGSYTIEISGEELALPIVIPYDYVGPDKILDILISIRDAENIGDEIVQNSVPLSLDVADYGRLTKDGREMFEKLMGQVEFELPADGSTDENRARIKDETKKLFDAYSRAICISLFESIESSAAAADWLERYYSALAFDVDDSATSYDEGTITEYLETVKSDEDFVKRLIAAKDLDTEDKIKEYIYESALLAVIAEKRGSVVKDMMNEFPELFDIDSSALEKLSVSKQSACFNNVAGNAYSTYAEATEAVNDEIESASGTGKKGSSGGGGGSASSSGTSSGTLSIGSTAPKADTEESTEISQALFNDVDSSHWAYDAIALLNSRGIISGMGDGSFAPDSNVTRAEFIKMITLAMSLEIGSTDAPFADVSAADWFAPYVAAAYREGIVLGDDNGNFNPDANITREDMATILYRVLKLNTQGTELTFTDRDEISGYAAEAVAYFSSRGIINGMGDGSFAPKAYATRAQAARLLYNVITS